MFVKVINNLIKPLNLKISRIKVLPHQEDYLHKHHQNIDEGDDVFVAINKKIKKFLGCCG